MQCKLFIDVLSSPSSVPPPPGHRHSGGCGGGGAGAAGGVSLRRELFRSFIEGRLGVSDLFISISFSAYVEYGFLKYFCSLIMIWSQYAVCFIEN